MIPSIGGPEMIIFLVIVLLLFGAKRIPELARGLGTGIKEFRRGAAGEDEVAERERLGKLPEGGDAFAEQRR